MSLGVVACLSASSHVSAGGATLSSTRRPLIYLEDNETQHKSPINFSLDKHAKNSSRQVSSLQT
jgi:hypothetical protein